MTSRIATVLAGLLLAAALPAATVPVTGTDTTTKTYASPDGDIAVSSWTAASTARITMVALTEVRFGYGVTVKSGATLSVRATNYPPTALPVTVSGAPDSVIPIALLGSDANGDVLTYATSGGPSQGTLEGSGAARTYRPNAGATGADSFVYTVSDGYASAQATVSITLAAPSVVAVDDAYVYPATGALVVGTGTGLLANDTGTALTAAVLAPPAHGVLSGVGTNGAFTYTANAGYIGRDSFQYRTNGTGGSATAWATIDVASGLSGTQNGLVPVRDGASFSTNEAAYLAAVVPGRVWDTLAPGSGVPILKAVGSRYHEVAAGGSVTLSVQTVAGKPATFYCLGEGTFGNGKNAVSVKADASGVASVALTPRGRCVVIAGSIAASSMARIVVSNN